MKLKKKCKNCGNKFTDKTRNHIGKFCKKKCLQSYHNKRYIRKNKEKYYKSYRKWVEKNREKVLKYSKEYNKKYYIKNKEKIDKKHREYYHNNKEKRTRKIKEYYENNKEKIIEYRKEYNQTPKGRLTNTKKHSKRRALKKKAKNTLTRKELKTIKERDKKCVYCGTKKNLTFDHIIPLNNSGENSFLNGVMACGSCNKSKREKDVFKWCKSKGYEVPKIIIKNLNKMKNKSKLKKEMKGGIY